MKNFLQLLFVTVLILMGATMSKAHSQKLNGNDQYFEKTGVFVNPDFVNGKTGWTISGGCTQAYDATIPFAERAIKFTCVAATFSIKQCTTVFAGFENAYIEYYSSIKVNATSTPVTWNILENGTDNLYSKEILQDDKFHALSYPSFAPSGNDCIEVKSEPLFTGTITLTQVNITQKLTSVRSINDVDTDFIPYTPTFTGFGTVTVSDFRYKRVGDSMVISGSFTCGTPTAVEAQISLPLSLEIKSGYTKKSVGSYFRDVSSQAKGGSVIVTGGDTYLNLGLRGTFSDYILNPSDATTGDTICSASGEGINFTTGLIPIEGWQTGRVDAIGQRAPSPEMAGFVSMSFTDFKGFSPEGFEDADGGCVLKTKYPDYTKNMLKGDNSYVYGECTITDTDDGVLKPDARGYFFRALDDMGTAAGAAGVDVDGTARVVGEGQNDVFSSHNHGGGSHTHNLNYKTSGGSGAPDAQFASSSKFANFGSGGSTDYYTGASGSSSTRSGFVAPAGNISSQGGTETRPKNMAIKAYVRMINQSTIIGMFKQTQIKKDEDKYSETEVKWGLWNGEQLYRRCFTVGSDITSSGDIVTWDSGLVPKNITNFSGTLWEISRITSTTTAEVGIRYDSSDGKVKATINTYKVGAGTSHCMEYVK